MKTKTQQRTTTFILVFFFSFLCIFLMTNTTFAQRYNGSKIKLNPKYPTPGETVRAELFEHSVDDSTALITWRINGEIAQKAYSEKVFSFTAGEIGTSYLLSVSAKDAKGSTAYVERTISVNDLSFAWEGKTYTHAFYKGKPLQSSGSDVAIQALPVVVDNNGNLYEDTELFFSWFSNSKSGAVSSGKGNSSVVLTNKKPSSPLLVYLEVRDPKGDIRITKDVTIPNTVPQVVLYEDSSIVGVRHDYAIKEVFGIYGGESTIIAEPYYMSASIRTDSSLDYNWLVGDNKYTSSGALSFGTEEGKGSGTTLLNLTIRNSSYWLQSARVDTKIEFGQRSDYGNTNIETKSL